MKNIFFLKQERGSALIIAILTLLVLSLAGLMAMNTATIETLISGNFKSYKENFYKADASVREMALLIQNTPDDKLINNTLVLLNGNDFSAITTAGNLFDVESVLAYRQQIVADPFTHLSHAEPIYNSKVLVVHGGVASGASMSIGHSHTNSVKHRFFVFSHALGNTNIQRGALIEIGYLKLMRY